MTTYSGFVPDDQTPVYVISVAAQLAGMHAQTLRQYDRLGLVSPSRTRGGGRRYSARDIELLREVQRLSQDEGVSLAGIQRVMQLEHQVGALQQRVEELLDALEQAEADRAAASAAAATASASSASMARVFAAGRAGDVVAVRVGERPARSPLTGQSLVVWRPS